MAATDDFSTCATPPSGPSRHAALVTPSDSVDLTNVSRALFVGGAGNIKVTTIGGETLLLTGVAAGSVLPLCVTRVWSTTTTATNIAALW